MRCVVVNEIKKAKRERQEGKQTYASADDHVEEKAC